MELEATVRTSSEAYRVIREARRNGYRKIILYVPAQDPAGAAEVVRGALAEASFLTVEVRVMRDAGRSNNNR
ncbi:hypothetical protein [Infirmifilum sp.]|uniref:hypothetical protein n=1 Tax=Infirmifilum sp. TaxID=2856575 RepID=UPI003D14424D